MSVIIDLGCIGRPAGSVVRQIGRRGTIIEIDIIPLRPDHLPVIIDLGLLGISVVRQIGRRGTIIEINILRTRRTIIPSPDHLSVIIDLGGCKHVTGYTVVRQIGRRIGALGAVIKKHN